MAPKWASQLYGRAAMLDFCFYHSTQCNYHYLSISLNFEGGVGGGGEPICKKPPRLSAGENAQKVEFAVFAIK